MLHGSLLPLPLPTVIGCSSPLSFHLPSTEGLQARRLLAVAILQALTAHLLHKEGRCEGWGVQLLFLPASPPPQTASPDTYRRAVGFRATRRAVSVRGRLPPRAAAPPSPPRHEPFAAVDASFSIRYRRRRCLPSRFVGVEAVARRLCFTLSTIFFATTIFPRFPDTALGPRVRIAQLPVMPRRFSGTFVFGFRAFSSPLCFCSEARQPFLNARAHDRASRMSRYQPSLHCRFEASAA